MASTRLNKYISDSGLCSRREADRYIEQGAVFVNGKRAGVGDQVGARDKVVVNGNLIEALPEEEAVYIAYNKPPGVTTTTTAGIKDNIIRAIKHSVRLVPVGQLDKEAQGLVLLTSNGEMVNRILRAANHENEYIVMLDKPLTEAALDILAAGGGQAGAEGQNIRVTKETPYIFRIALLHDTIRQVRRWCEQLGYEVVQMERIRVMNVSVKALGLGEWRELRAGELKVLLESVAQAGTAAAPRRRKRPDTSAFWTERPARRPAATPTDDAPRAGRPKPAGPGTAKSARLAAGPAQPAGTKSARPAPGKTAAKPSRPAGPRPTGAGKSPAASKGKPSNRGSRGANRTGKRS